MTVQRLGASRAEDDSDDEKKSLQPYSDGMDEPDSFVPNGNGVARKISSGHFPQWPTSYPSNVAVSYLYLAFNSFFQFLHSFKNYF